MQKEINVKIFLRKNQYIIKFKSSHLKGEMVCENIVHLDNALNKIISAFSDTTSFSIRFSQGALGRYIWEMDSPFLLFKMGYRFSGYAKNSDARIFYNDELAKLIVIDDEGWLQKYDL